MSDPANQPDALSFEDAMERLDEIVDAMETDRMPLEDMIRSYEEGIQLLKSCRQRIEGARRRVESISADLDSGKATIAPFDPSAAADGGEAGEDETPAKKKPSRRKAAESGEIRLF